MLINNNSARFIQTLKQMRNPQDFAMNMLEQQAQNNPLFSNLLTLAKGNRTEEIELIARNMFKERGLDFDKELSNFKSIINS